MFSEHSHVVGEFDKSGCSESHMLFAYPVRKPPSGALQERGYRNTISFMILTTQTIFRAQFWQQEKPCFGLPWWRSGQESACQCRGHGFEPWSRKIPRAAEQLSPCTTTTEPELWSPRATTTEARVPRARAPQQEKPPQREARALQRRIAPAQCN